MCAVVARRGLRLCPPLAVFCIIGPPRVPKGDVGQVGVSINIKVLTGKLKAVSDVSSPHT